MHICRSTYLIIYYSHGIMLLCDIEHGTYEVVTVDGKCPGYPHYKEVVDSAFHCLLAGKLSRTVYRQRIKSLIIGIPGLIPASVKYVVSTDIEHLAARLFTSRSYVSRSLLINLKYHLPVFRILCGIHRCPASGMYNCVGSNAGKQLFHCYSISDIKLYIAKALDLLIGSAKSIGYIASDTFISSF